MENLAKQLVVPCVNNGKNSGLNTFFLEQVERACKDMGGSSVDLDQPVEIKLYLSHLLTSITNEFHQFDPQPYVSSYDIDVQRYLEDHPGLRNEYTVYKANAEWGLCMVGIFLHILHAGSYHHHVLGQIDDRPRIALYYKLAASALMHLYGNRNPLCHVYLMVADNIERVSNLLRKVAGDYFDIMQRISDGTMFHLERSLAEDEKNRVINEKMDLFLKVLAEYRSTGDLRLRIRVRELTREIHALKEDFCFDESTL